MSSIRFQNLDIILNELSLVLIIIRRSWSNKSIDTGSNFAREANIKFISVALTQNYIELQNYIEPENLALWKDSSSYIYHHTFIIIHSSSYKFFLTGDDRLLWLNMYHIIRFFQISKKCFLGIPRIATSIICSIPQSHYSLLPVAKGLTSTTTILPWKELNSFIGPSASALSFEQNHNYSIEW